MDLNKVMIIGRLTRDPELRTIPSGASVAQVSVATNFRYTNQAGQKVDQVEYHNVVLWRGLADIAAKYLKKGSQVYIEGRLQTRNWEGQDGKKNYRTEIVGDNMIMLGGSGGSSTGTPGLQSGYNNATKPAPKAENTDYQLEELPTIQQDETINLEDVPF
ncbi:MAG TPA: single-stranded DNA-binding protein [Patescibacteria group bacterium]|nr:single-stranded DNA-binding protein [Patescibacteria group bacterium]